MRKLTPSFYIKRALNSKTPSEAVRTGSDYVLYWFDYFSYQIRLVLK
jgi:hypothetical protein